MLSRRSVDGDKIKWDLDGLGVGFSEGYNFESGPALREGDPAKYSHVKCGATWNTGVVPCGSILGVQSVRLEGDPRHYTHILG